MYSALYECTVMHHRLVPKVHRFEYGLFYLWLDLDELDALDKGLALFSRNRWNLFSFHDQDHLVKDAAETKANILQVMSESGVDTAKVKRVRLLTFPRILGYIFNPVCFYYAFDEADRPVCAVAEVTNTFHEQKPYVLTALNSGEEGFRQQFPKHFYVSPFFDLELHFDFKLRLPDDKLEIHVDDRRGDERVILTCLKGTRRELTDMSLLACAVKYPLLTLKVISLIHWHALRLWLKGLPVYRKRDRADLQRGVFRPHVSIAPIKP